MSLTRRPLRVALLSVAALLSVGVGVGLAAGAPSSPADELPVMTSAAQAAPTTSDAGSERAGGEGFEGPGTDARPAPVYSSVSPTSWTITVPEASVYRVAGDTDTLTGSITDRSADIAGTGRAATVGQTQWFEVKVPGATTGWVVGTELARR